MKNKGVSVIICCHNSALLLPETLRYLSKQSDISLISVEIIVIDNNSEDNTTEIAVTLFRDLPIECNIYYEEKIGLMNARRMGIDVAKYEYLLFCDDDNLLDSKYISKAYHIMESDNSIGACGGLGTELIHECIKPECFDKYKKSYAIGSQVIYPQLALYGAGICLRYSSLEKIYQNGFISYLSGRKGAALSAGDDGELVLAIIIAGYRLVASDELFFFHLIPQKRLTQEYLIKMYKGFGLMYPVLYIYRRYIRNKNSKISKSKILFELSALMLKSLIYALCNKGIDRKVFLIYTIGFFKGFMLYRNDFTNIYSIIDSISKSNNIK